MLGLWPSKLSQSHELTANHMRAPGQLLPLCNPQAREDADSHVVLDFSASPVLTTTPVGYVVVPHFTRKQAEAPRGEETSPGSGSLEVEGPPPGPLAPSPQTAPLGSHVGKAARLMRVSAAGPRCSQLSHPDGWASKCFIT